MPKYNFNQLIDRKGSQCTKYDGYGSLQSDYADIIPLWIADMDFETPSFIIDAIINRLKHPILGYATVPDHYYEAICEWFVKRYGIKTNRDEIEYTPGVVSGIYKLIGCLTDKGDSVLITPPVYYPFANVINHSERELLEAPLILKNGRYEMDWDKMECAMQKAKVFVLCHPHNPGGRVWQPQELKRIASLAKKHNTIVISDEIHADLTHRAYKHIPFPAVSDEASQVSITLMAPSKAFNMPGVLGSHLYIKDKCLREKVFAYMQGNGLSMGDCFTYDAIAAAYQEGEEWLDECLEYIEQNISFTKEYLQKNIPQIKMISPDASFLIFLDCQSLGFESTDDLNQFMIQKAGILLNEGSTFGTGGAHYMRINVGCPRQTLEQALQRLEKAVKELDV